MTNGMGSHEIRHRVAGEIVRPTADRSARASLAGWLSNGNWLTPERARIFTRLWLAMSIGTIVIWVGLSQGGIDLNGKPIGTDFSSFWTASRLALEGHPAAAYDVAAHHAAQTKLFGREVRYYAFFYPPVFLLICLPLAILPYLASLGIWLAATGAAYVLVVRRFAGQAVGWASIFAFPAVLENAGHGQNGYLSTALLGGGLLLLDRRPWLAGILLGCLAYKPQLGLVIPVALLASGRWKSVLGAAGAVLSLVFLSILAFGTGAWRSFFTESAFAKIVLEQGIVGDAKMESAFAAVRLLHGGVFLAYGVQALVAVSALIFVIIYQRRRPRSTAEGPAIATATLLCTPFLLDYDLVMLAIPLAWLTAEALRTGFRPWEKTILAAAFILPICSRSIATAIGVPLGPLIIMAVFWLVLRRWSIDQEPGSMQSLADVRHRLAPCEPAFDHAQ